MCRLFIYACERPTPAAEVLGEDTYRRFRQLARLHRDGWGMAWLSPHDGLGGAEDGLIVEREGSIAAARSLTPADHDPDFDTLARRPLGRAGMVHLRWATAGLDVTAANTHPFLADGWAFAHQGSIPTPERVEAGLEPAWASRLRGKTDSERYFLYLLQCAAEVGDIVAGAQRAVGDIVDRCGPTSLNALLLSESQLIVVHGTGGLEPSLEDMVDVLGSDEQIPPEHREAYYRLRYRSVAGMATVISSGLGGGEGWIELPDECLVSIALSDGALLIHPFR